MKDDPPAQGRPAQLKEDELPFHDGDWLKISRAWVTKADERVNAQATVLVDAVRWVFGLGSGGLLLALVMDKVKAGPATAVVLAGAVLCLFLAHNWANRARMAWSGLQNTLNDPDGIGDAHAAGAIKANGLLQRASRALMFGMLLIPLAFTLPPRVPQARLAQRDPVQCTASIVDMHANKDTVVWSTLHLEFSTQDTGIVEFALSKGRIYRTAVPIWHKSQRSDSTTTVLELRFEPDTLLAGEFLFVSMAPSVVSATAMVRRVQADVLPYAAATKANQLREANKGNN